MEKLMVGDVEMCYRRTGEGPPLLMIMGLTANMDWWAPELLERLARDFSLVLLDNRGAGRSSNGTLPFSIRQFACDAAGLMRELGLERAHVMGVSMGGMIAQELALGWPAMVDRLVLCCTSCGGFHVKFPRWPAMKALLRPRVADPREQALQSAPILFPQPWLSQHPEIVDHFAETVAKAPISRKNAQRQIGAVMRYNTYSRLGCIGQPTLVLSGLADVLIPPENSLTLARGIRGARLKVFEGAGHGFTTQCAAEVAEAAAEFLLPQ